MLIAAAAVLLAACGTTENPGSSPTTSAGPDAADCSGGAQAANGLQTAIRQLSDGLSGIGPASERNDLNAVLDQIDSARGAADTISGGLGAAAATMTASSLIRTEFQNAATSGADLRSTLDGLRAALAGGPGPGDQSAQLQTAITAFNTALERLSLACSSNFSATTVEPTTVSPTRTAR
ncbi:hypothetical protein [Nocardia seriolae]|uniref:Uncharacterized protein n=1 Tax=Nocardia seriolae TaxID=37332 RepID=A0A0B8N4B9_9NOCA|nr:hypothetical protein [Nocardia seriolae]MTJ64974.1 hypothetical protein [Nocardia seriolae]MTJ71828.1 hypothetical protein [Nocardia seriolae]MTJ89788.1 hypothetical protein [Nocardia seriolae]MTK33764.1 hypothetical protein [Nocardia seriolae]MTK42919.1 hypothetical protein [Nocardia seriolae]